MEKKHFIYGLHSVIEALKNEEQVEKILLNKGIRNESYDKIIQLAQDLSIKISFVPAVKFNKYKEINHQDAIAFLSPIKYQNFEEVIEKVLDKKDKALFLLLDGVTDVRNLGSILRTAECTGVDAVILPKNNSASINEDAVKTSAGAVFNIPICKVNHINDAIFYLKSSGITIVAASEKADDYAFNKDLNKPLALIMGDEGKGISQNVLKNTDERIKLPIKGEIGSLNVAVACGATLYEIIRQQMG